MNPADEASLPPPETPAPPRLSRERRGIIARALRLFGLAGDVGSAAVALANAEIELARAALPWSIGWFCAALVFGVSLVGCAWLGILLLLYRWTGSLGIALGLMAAASALAFVVSALLLLRTAHMLSFPETRHRIVAWLHRRKKDDQAPASTTN
ncbi:MAG: hypothetical protein ABI411_21065 [Tahibacter sp.]